MESTNTRESPHRRQEVPEDESSLDDQFVFISVQNPEDAKDREKRRQARSHALRQSLRNKRLQQGSPSDESQWKIWQPTGTVAEPMPVRTRPPAKISVLHSLSASIPDSSGLRELFNRNTTVQAIEPIFTIEDEVVFQAFRSVFRTGLEDPALLNAVMLAFKFGESSGIIDEDCLYYKGQAMHFIRKRMGAPTQAATEATLGAILLIAGVEARLGMRSQVQIHMKGIKQLLKSSALARVQLSDGIKRAIFWQDLNASVMTGSERVVDHSTFTELTWKRDPFAPLLFELPVGFEPLTHLFTDEFVEILKDINALKSIRNSPNFVPDAVALVHIDNQQAWIESRLWALPKGGPFQECCNFAAYLSANLLCCKVWRTSAIPPYLSSQILRILKEIVDTSEWNDHPDLLLWVLYIGGSVARERVVRLDYMALLESSLAHRWEGVKPAWPDLVKVMENFFWSENGFGPTVKAFWEEIQEDVGF